MEVTERDERTFAPGSDDAGDALLEKGKRGLKEILGGSGLQAKNPWLREVVHWIAGATTQCWRAVPAMIIDGVNPTTKDLIECTFDRLKNSLESFKIEWTEHVKARRKASKKENEKKRRKDRASKHDSEKDKGRASKHDSEKDKAREKGRSKGRASKRGRSEARMSAAERKNAQRMRSKMNHRIQRDAHAKDVHSRGRSKLADVDRRQIGTEADCVAALVRRSASTNVFMLMNYPAGATERHIEDFIAVTPQRKRELVRDWQENEMASALPLTCCAGCGVQDSDQEYVRRVVPELSKVFRLDSVCLKRWQKLHDTCVQLIGTRLEVHDGREVEVFYKLPELTNLAPIMSCYKGADGHMYHLHSELVEQDEALYLCENCDRLNQGDLSLEKSFSIAAGKDYGRLDRIPELKPTSLTEQRLLAPSRLYHLTFSVASVYGNKAQIIAEKIKFQPKDQDSLTPPTKLTRPHNYSCFNAYSGE
jgi:hypothetical protein